MTIPEFLDRLHAIAGPWRVTSWGAIRGPGNYCPIFCLGPRDRVLWDAADALGLSPLDARRIVAAADSVDLTVEGLTLRNLLLAATVERPRPSPR